MGVFQNNVLKVYLANQDKDLIGKQYKKYKKYFHDRATQENIRKSKEEQFQEGFLRELFVNILGYTINPNTNFNLTTEFKNQNNAQKADGAILQAGKAIAVIELKGSKTKDLEKVRKQAFDYKANQPDCIYVITSNFERLRFYIDNAVDYEEFNLFTLNENEFSLLYLCLSKNNIFSNLPQKIKNESIVIEKKITNKLYADYSQFKRELFRALVRRNMKNEVFRAELERDDNEQVTKNIKLTLFEKSQKLLDRFLFIFFAEDRGLIPSNSTIKILNDWKDLKEKYDEDTPLYSRFKKYFNYLDTGRAATAINKEIYAYNGGLFKTDTVLDSLLIDDELLYEHAKRISEYDFDSQVSVNVLGHIFENSLNEIESINAEIEGVAFDKQTSKRKTDGVFYTPQYITHYIVESTVGKLCSVKKEELKIIEDEYFRGKDGRQKKTIESLNNKLEAYRNWLLDLTILDPACGSGAFLNEALEFLIKEHRYIDELHASLYEQVGFSQMVFTNIENTILEKNIFGVDLNEEAVEIAKLSLWLRSAQPRRKLNNLSSNIKCGNSLISSKSVAGDKAFMWEEEFEEIFAKGGFDIVIGNPPYVGEKGNSNIFNQLKRIPKWKDYYRRRTNLYYFFIKQGLDLLKENGLQSLIIPREFTNADWANKVRKVITDDSIILSIIDFKDSRVFDDAGTSSLILTHKKCRTNQEIYNLNFKKIDNSNEIIQQVFDSGNIQIFKSDTLGSDGLILWLFNNSKTNYHTENIIPLGKLYNISQGIVTGADKVSPKHIAKKLIDTSFLHRGIFILKEGVDYKVDNGTYKLKIMGTWVLLSEKDLQFLKPFIKKSDLKQWYVESSKLLIIYIGTHTLTENIRKYLEQFSGVLLNRSTLIKEGEIITLADFDKFELSDVKLKYSSAGAVQKIMRKKKWYLPLYERENLPFDEPKIIVNTKDMGTFTFSSSPAYSSGGGAGGQNFIYPNKNPYWEKVLQHTSVKDFVLFTNCILNGTYIRDYLSKASFNQLSTAKIENLPIIEINFDNYEHVSKYKDVVTTANSIIICIIKQKNYQNLLVAARESNEFDREILLQKELEEVSLIINTSETRIKEIIKFWGHNTH